jgi:uncharacterized protein (TIGR03435 family)
MQAFLRWLVLASLSACALGAQERPRSMSADVNPSFDVVTIKPSSGEEAGKDFEFEGRIFSAKNYNVNDLIALAYGMHPNQIVGAPGWFGSALFDIQGIPDFEGIPNQRQKVLMMQKLLSDRFGLDFHYGKKRLPAYTITVGPGGVKARESMRGPDEPERYRFHGLGTLQITNMTIAEFAVWFQKTVTDKPLVDETGLKARYDFTLTWTPDDSQFTQMRGAGWYTITQRDDPNAPPNLFKAFQDELGLNLKAVRAPISVMVVDRCERPSAN